MFAPFRWLGLGVVKVAISFAAGGGVSLLAMGALAMYDPERWDHHVLDQTGPPIGPMLLSIGSGLATAAGTLHALFFSPSQQAVRDGHRAMLQGAGRT